MNYCSSRRKYLPLSCVAGRCDLAYWSRFTVVHRCFAIFVIFPLFLIAFRHFEPSRTKRHRRSQTLPTEAKKTLIHFIKTTNKQTRKPKKATIGTKPGNTTDHACSRRSRWKATKERKGNRQEGTQGCQKVEAISGGRSFTSTPKPVQRKPLRSKMCAEKRQLWIMRLRPISSMRDE